MKLNKRVLFRIHGWIGIKLGILFFIVCFSGTLATLSHEMDWLFFPQIRAEFKEQSASKNKIVQNLQQEYPEGEITFWWGSRAPYLCDIVYLNIDSQRYYVFVNPYTGEVQGRTTLTFQRFFRDFHYFLFIPFQIGHFTVLFFGFLLFISTITALFFYKKWWRKLFELKLGKGRLVFYRSLHRLVGVWSIPFAILFSVTGVWYFLERANVGGIGTISNPSLPKVEHHERTWNDSVPVPYQIDYDSAVEVAQQAIPQLDIKDILPPNQKNKILYLNGISHVPLVRSRANRVYINPVSNQLIKVQQAKEIPLVMYFNDIADPLHFGYWGGLITKVIWFVGGFAISSLILTGIWIALKRQLGKQAEKDKQVLGIWKYINWGIISIMFVFMMYSFIDRYAATLEVFLIVGSFFGLLGFSTWYLFVFKLNRSLKRSVHKER